MQYLSPADTIVLGELECVETRKLGRDGTRTKEVVISGGRIQVRTAFAQYDTDGKCIRADRPTYRPVKIVELKALGLI